MQPKILLAGYRGSIAHGLYVKDGEFGICDTDTFEIYSYPWEYYFSLEGYYHSRENVDEKIDELDMVGYELRKAVHLLAGCNPNVIGWLYSKPEHYTTISKGGQLLIDNRHIFLARRRIRDAFSGYAHSQLKRLTKHSYRGYMGKKRKEIVDKYGYDTKNAVTLVRLLRHAQEILLTGEMQTFREKDRDFLLEIKTGKYSLTRLHELTDKEFKKTEEAYEKSTLPLENSRKEVTKLLIKILEVETK